MSSAKAADAGKSHADENFPVASILIAPRNRPLVMAFYRVARMADDIADHPSATAHDKLAGLAAIEATLLGQGEAVNAAAALRGALAARGLSNQHILDLLEAFRRDVVKTRYADWEDLMDYCRYSAAPVGRFMLDAHDQNPAAWPASDALCAALQVINHLQDCAKDYRDLDRVYVPLDAMKAAGVEVEALGAGQASQELRGVLSGLAGRTRALLDSARPLSGMVRDPRLSLEIGVIQALADSLTMRLARRDPLSQRVHHRSIEALGIAVLGMGAAVATRLKARQARRAGA